VPQLKSARPVGRDAELRLLGTLLTTLRAGRGRAAWIEGEPGIGKSTLVGRLAEAAGAAGCQVFQGAGQELAQPLPLRLLAGSLGVSAQSTDPLRAEIVGLLRGGTGNGAADPVLAAGERLVELVDRVCAAGPVLLVTEDLHWADDASLHAWYQLARSVDQIPLLLVGTCRPVPLRTDVLRLRDAIADDPGAVLVTLGPLSAQDAAELAGRLAGAAPGPRLAAELAQAGGNPLYLRELVDALARDGQLDLAGGTAELRTRAGPAPAPAPVSLTAAIGRRLRFLTEDTYTTLRIAAVLGAEFLVTDLALATGQPASALLPAIEEATAAGVLSHDQQQMIFRHDLIHQALTEQTPAPVRAALHAQLARQLADAGRPLGQIATHLLAASEALDTVDTWALDWLAALPEPTLYAAPQVAADLLTRAVDQVGRDDPRWAALAGRLAVVLSRLNRNEEAEQVATDVRQRTADPAEAARMACYAAQAATRLGRYDEALAAVEQAQEIVALPAVWRARLRARNALTLWNAGRAGESAALARQAAAEGEQAGDGHAVGRAEYALCLVADRAGRLVHLDRALAVLAALGEDPELAQLRLALLNNRVITLADLDRREEAEAAMREALVLGERAGTLLPEVRTSAAVISYEYGDWDEALVYLDPVTGPLGHRELLMSLGVRALIAGHREDHATAAAHLAAATKQVPQAVGSLRAAAAHVTAARALAAEVAGDLRGAVVLLATWLDPALGPTYNRNDWLPELVRLALATADTDTARAAVAAADADADADPTPILVSAARRCRAQLDDDPAGLLAVADYYRRTGRLRPLAATLEEAAVRLAAAGDVPGARAALTDAVRGYQEMGASWDIRRADDRLRPYGVHRGSRTFRRRPTTGWAALTPAEQRIAELVAAGKSNPEVATDLYLSRRTVQSHVSNILKKLRLSSRYEIAPQLPR